MRRGTLAILAAVALTSAACRIYFGQPLDPSAPNIVPHVITPGAPTITTSVPAGWLAPGVEGSVLFLRLTDTEQHVILDRPFDWNNDSQRVPPGDYQLEAYARGCNGNCGNLSPAGPPFCAQAVHLVSGARLTVAISGGNLAPGLTCTLKGQ